MCHPCLDTRFIVTPEGDTPPQLNDPAIPTMGQRRSKRVREYRSELEELQLKALLASQINLVFRVVVRCS